MFLKMNLYYQFFSKNNKILNITTINTNTLQKYKNYDVEVRFSGKDLKFTQKKTINLTYPFEIYISSKVSFSISIIYCLNKQFQWQVIK